MIEFNSFDKELPQIKIDGELFEVRPIGGGLLLDIEELQTTLTENTDDLSSIRKLYEAVESLLVSKGKLTAKEALRRIPAKKLGKLVKILVEV